MFNPIAQPKGKDSEVIRRVWCAENVQMALDAYQQGIPLVDKPFITGEPMQRKANLIYEWSEWELNEAAHCKADICYFAETYCKLYNEDGTYSDIKLFEYQKKILRAFQKNRYLIMLASRQMGKTTTTAICLLWVLLFSENEKIALLGDKEATAIENLTKIKEIYYRLPFFLKAGVVAWNQTFMSFDNGNLIFGGPCNLATIVGRTISILYFDELAIPDAAQSRAVVEFAFPTVSALKRSKIIISSSPRGDNIFKELWIGAVSGTNAFHPIRIDWWERPGRDEVWKQEQIALLGGEKAFQQQYGNQFLTGVSDWLDEDASEYMEDLMKESSYKTIDKLGAAPANIDILKRVESTIIRSRFMDKSVAEPESRLVNHIYFDSKYLPEGMSSLKDLPIIMTLDTGEGRKKDHTIVHFWLPELPDNAKEAYEQEISELDNALSDDRIDNVYDDDLYDLVDDDADLDAIESEFMLINNIRCRQIGVLDSNEHQIAMVALFMQLFIKMFLNQDKCKLICELDGCGAKMRALLGIDIVKNSGLDYEIFGGVEPKNASMGINMRGTNKRKYVGIAENMFAGFRMLMSYPASIFEARKFGEIKKGQYAGIGVHDDHVMSAILLAAFMESSYFKSFVENAMFDDDDADEEMV
jgi:hypothetical protein